MAIGPRLDLRQSQSLVMTPQLRQAIQLLQFNNLEAAAFIEQELERNPLLERDESGDFAVGDRPAPDQVVVPASDTPRDVSEAARSDDLPAEGAAPLDTAEYAETYDPGGASDGASGGSAGSGGGFDGDERSIDDFAESSMTLREHLGLSRPRSQFAA